MGSFPMRSLTAQLAGCSGSLLLMPACWLGLCTRGGGRGGASQLHETRCATLPSSCDLVAYMQGCGGDGGGR